MSTALVEKTRETEEKRKAIQRSESLSRLALFGRQGLLGISSGKNNVNKTPLIIPKLEKSYSNFSFAKLLSGSNSTTTSSSSSLTTTSSTQEKPLSSLNQESPVVVEPTVPVKRKRGRPPLSQKKQNQTTVAAKKKEAQEPPAKKKRGRKPGSTSKQRAANSVLNKLREKQRKKSEARHKSIYGTACSNSLPRTKAENQTKKKKTSKKDKQENDQEKEEEEGEEERDDPEFIKTEVVKRFKNLFSKSRSTLTSSTSSSKTTKELPTLIVDTSSTTITSNSGSSKSNLPKLPRATPSSQTPSIPRSAGGGVDPILSGTQRAPETRMQTIVPPATVSTASSVYSRVAQDKATEICSKQLAETKKQQQQKRKRENLKDRIQEEEEEEEEENEPIHKNSKRGYALGLDTGNGSGYSDDSACSDSDEEEKRKSQKKRANKNNSSSNSNLQDLVQASVPNLPFKKLGGTSNNNNNGTGGGGGGNSSYGLNNKSLQQPYNVSVNASKAPIKDGSPAFVMSLERCLPEILESCRKKENELEKEEEKKRVDATDPNTLLGAMDVTGGIGAESADRLTVFGTLSLMPYSKEASFRMLQHWLAALPEDNFTSSPSDRVALKECYRSMVPVMHRTQMRKYNVEVLPGDLWPVCKNAASGSCEGLALEITLGKDCFAPRAFFYEDEEVEYLPGPNGEPPNKPWPTDRRCSLCIIRDVCYYAMMLRTDHTSVPSCYSIQDYRVNDPGCFEFNPDELLTNPEQFSIGLTDPVIRHARNKYQLANIDGRRCYIELYGWPGRDPITFF